MFHEDNEAMIRVLRTGKNPTMCALARTHGVAVASLKEFFVTAYVELVYTKSSRQAADVYTKGFTHRDQWCHATTLIGGL